MMIKTKLALTTSILAMAGATQASCTSPVNGAYVGAAATLTGTTARMKTTTKEGRVSGVVGSGYSKAMTAALEAQRKLHEMRDSSELYEEWQSVVPLTRLDDENDQVSLANNKDSKIQKLSTAMMGTIGSYAGFLKGQNIQLVAFTGEKENTKSVDLSDKAVYAPTNEGESGVVMMNTAYTYRTPLKLIFENGNTVFSASHVVLAATQTIDPALMQRATAEYLIEINDHVVGFLAATDKVNGTTVSEVFPATTSANKSYSNNGGAELSVGYGGTIGSVVYVAAEASGGLTLGKTRIQEIPAAKSKTHQVSNTKFATTYDTEVTSGGFDSTLKEKFNACFTAILGITSGTWIIYTPLVVKLAKYEIAMTPASIGSIGTSEVTYSGSVAGQALRESNKVTGMSMVATEDSGDTAAEASTYKKGKTRISFGCGLGARVLLSKHWAIDIRLVRFWKTSSKISTPPFKNAIPSDPNQLGTENKVTHGSYKLTFAGYYLI